MKSTLQKKMVADLQLQGHKERTQKSYLRSVRQLEPWSKAEKEFKEQMVQVSRFKKVGTGLKIQDRAHMPFHFRNIPGFLMPANTVADRRIIHATGRY